MFPEGRLFDFMIVGAVALIVVGPKDLPLLMRKVGQFMARVRGMAAEFRASFDELARQSELDELRREVQALRSAQPTELAMRGLGAEAVAADIDAGLGGVRAALGEPPGASAPPATAAEPPPSSATAAEPAAAPPAPAAHAPAASPPEAPPR